MVETVPGAKTIAVDPIKQMAYLFQPERGTTSRLSPSIIICHQAGRDIAYLLRAKTKIVGAPGF